MLKGKADAVEGDGVFGEGVAAAVFAVAKNGTVDFGELQADLMFAAGEETDLEKHSQFFFAERAIAEAGVLGRAGARGDDFHAALAVVL